MEPDLPFTFVEPAVGRLLEVVDQNAVLPIYRRSLSDSPDYGKAGYLADIQWPDALCQHPGLSCPVVLLVRSYISLSYMPREE